MRSSGYRWRDGDCEVTRSICWSPPGCHGGCGVLLYHKNGKLVDVAGDQENHFNRGRLCVRGLNIKEALYHPQRLSVPLVRKGDRGQNLWQETSIESALNIIADKFGEIKSKFGAQSVIFAKGTARDIGAYLPRLCYGFGSPNYFGFGPANGNACYRPRVAVSTAILGSLPIPDLGQFDSSVMRNQPAVLPECLLIWGANPIHSNPDGLFGGWVTEAMKWGTELIVIDPQRTWLASRAKHWLQIKPGTDAALALGMIHLLFAEGRIDENFCRDWVIGFEEVRKAVENYTPERVEKITGLKAEEILATTRFFADSKPVGLIWGVAVDMSSGCLGTISGLISLIVLTGNIEIPGGMILQGDPYGVLRRGDELADFPEMKTRRIGAKEYPMIEIGNPYGQPDVLLDQMETDDPYPIRAAWLQGTSVLPSSFADPQRVLRLFDKLDFTVFVDPFLTPAAAAFGDLVLPVAMYPEKDSLFVHYPQLGAINKAVNPPGECRSDAEIILSLGKKIAPEAFPWENVVEWLDRRLQPAGLTFTELREKGSLVPPMEYQKQVVGKLRTDGKPGFDTPSGKIELKSSILESCGLNPLPHFVDSLSRLQNQYGEEEYPWILTTGSRKPYYFCAEHRHLPSLRKLQPDPVVQIHPQTAQIFGIISGDTVEIASPFGSCIMKAEITNRFQADVIHCDFGWWFPEEKGDYPHLFGFLRSNVNSLLPSGLQGPGGFGYPFRGFPCKIKRMENPD